MELGRYMVRWVELLRVNIESITEPVSTTWLEGCEPITIISSHNNEIAAF